MLEHLPWTIAALLVGLFVGYIFGKYKGATELSGELDLEDETDEPRSPKTDRPSSQADADSSRTVFARRGGGHYHKEGCRHLRRRGGYGLTKGDALKKGFRRCPSCRP